MPMLVQGYKQVVAMTADHESLQIIQLDFTALRDQAPCLGRGVLPWNLGPALNGALRVPQSGGGFSGAGAGLATIRLGSCGNAACAVADPSSTAAPAPSSGLPTVVPTEPTETKAIELPILESGVPPTPEAGVLRILEAGMLPTETPQAAVRPPAPTKERSAVPRPDHIVVVILENKYRSSVITQAPHLNWVGWPFPVPN
jgi:hypothetical protein